MDSINPISPNDLKRYKQIKNQDNIPYWRRAFLLFIVLFALFGLLDLYFAEDYVNVFLFMRFSLVIPFFLASIALTYWHEFYKFANYVFLINFVVAGFTIATMLFFLPQNSIYFSGLLLVVFSGFFLLRIPVWYATLATIVIWLYMILGLVMSDGFTLNFVALNAFYIAASGIGVFGGRHIESLNLRNFMKAEIISQDRDDLSHRVNAQLKELHNAQTSTITALAKLVESRDLVTGEHIENVSKYAKLIAEHLDDTLIAQQDLSHQTFIHTIERASVLHDIGKVGIPDYILNKPSKLSKEEFDIIKTHVEIGHKTLNSIREKYPNNAFINMGSDITLYHHERYDGSGYVHGLKRQEIPLSARIMALVDVYDALISKRPYKEAYSHEKAMEIITKKSPGHFDPGVLKAFLRAEDKIKAIRFP